MVDDPQLRQTFARQIRLRRIDLGLKQQDVAHMIGISAAALNRIEAGTVEPKLSVVYRLLQILDLEMSILGSRQDLTQRRLM